MSFKFTALVATAFLGLGLTGVASADSVPASVQSALNKYYPYNSSYKCNAVKHEDAYFCSTIFSQKTVNTPNGQRLYVLVTGKAARGVDTSHANSGMVGMFVFKPNGNAWQVESARSTIASGSFGGATSGWKFAQFGPNVYGFVDEDGYTAQGVNTSSYVILTPKGNTIQESGFASGYDDRDGISCGDGEGSCTNLDSKLAVNRKVVKNGFYSLNVTVKGKKDNKPVNKTYRIDYGAQGYVAPKGYAISFE